MNEKSQPDVPMMSHLYEVIMPGFRTTCRALTEELARNWAISRYRDPFGAQEITIKLVPGEDEVLPVTATPSRKTVITEEQLKAIANMVEALFQQRSSFDMDSGTEKEILDAGERTLQSLKKEMEL